MKHIYLLLISCFLFSCVSIKVDTETDNTSENGEVSENLYEQIYDISMYPEPKKGDKRYIIELDKQDNESDYKLEIFIGKIMDIDCNQHNLMGTFEKLTAKGWGYPYFEFKTNGETISTLQGCLNHTKAPKFVHGEKKLLNYNSRLPIVVYAPEGYELRYNIWKKTNKTYNAN